MWDCFYWILSDLRKMCDELEIILNNLKINKVNIPLFFWFILSIKVYELLVLETKPENAVSIIECDMQVCVVVYCFLCYCQL